MKKYFFIASVLICLNTFALNYAEFLNSGNTTTNFNISNSVTEMINEKSKNLNNASVELQANNDYFTSVLLTTPDKKYVGLTIDNKTGKQINLKDLFVRGYENQLNEIIKQKLIYNFGITNNKFKGISTWFHQEFYLNDHVINVILTDVTEIGNKSIIVPIFPFEMRGLIK